MSIDTWNPDTCVVDHGGSDLIDLSSLPLLLCGVITELAAVVLVELAPPEPLL